MWLLLIPLLLVLIVFSLILGTAAVFIAIAREVPWLLIIAGVWIVWRSQRPRRHARRRHAAPPASGPIIEHEPVQPIRAVAIQAEPTRLTKRELPIDVQVKVEQIKRKADVLMTYADRFPPFSQDLHIVRQTTADYLPRTIDAYLALPGDEAFEITTGERVLQELREQLQILDTKLDEIAQDLQRQDLERLLANRQFLEQRFQPRAAEPAAQPADRAIEAA
ncbi:MAG: hypothetical protein ACKVVP_11910 [Chloroflexota bacterium]